MNTFAQQIYTLLKTVPRGKVTTYKALAHALGSHAYRAVGQLMRHNPYGYNQCSDENRRIPCHRVVTTHGMIGGFMGSTSADEIRKKITLLQGEGVRIEKNRVVDFKTHLYLFK